MNKDEKAFFDAVKTNEAEEVKKLLDDGADVNSVDEWGETPLMWAARGGWPEMALLLLERGADADAQNEEDDTALTLANRFGNTEVAKLLWRRTNE